MRSGPLSPVGPLKNVPMPEKGCRWCCGIAGTASVEAVQARGGGEPDIARRILQDGVHCIV